MWARIEKQSSQRDLHTAHMIIFLGIVNRVDKLKKLKEGRTKLDFSIHCCFSPGNMIILLL